MSSISDDVVLPPFCGIVMPIAAMGSDYPEAHWKDVRAIIDSAIKLAGYTPRIVSDAKESTVIHKSIINNLYEDLIVVCDVSGKNPNVMFELGMRLAFNKPVVIIKDDVTGYSFDTSNIQHLSYRKDLRHASVELFITQLASKIKATYDASIKEGYEPFLSHFGSFTVSSIDSKHVLEGEALEQLLNQVGDLHQKINSISNTRLENLDLLFSQEFDLVNDFNFTSTINELTHDFGDYIDIKVIKKLPLIHYKYKFLVLVSINSSLSENLKNKLKNEIIQKLSEIDDLPF